MDLDDWITADQALAMLQIKPQTLYAYVSRGRIRALADPSDTRRSLYSRYDVEALLAARARPRRRADIAANTMAWGEPILESGISRIQDGVLYFGPRSASDWAAHDTFEALTCRHWRMPNLPPDASALVPFAQGLDRPSLGASAKERGFIYLATSAGRAPSSLGRSDESLRLEAWSLLYGFTNALLGGDYQGALHNRFALAWGGGDALSDAVRRALILISDHELNASTFAVRVAASAGAPLPAACLAGLATLSGTRHGEATAASFQFLKKARQAPHVAAAIDQSGASGGFELGFGHRLYPQGDPRAAALLGALPLPADLLDTLNAAGLIFGWPANVDAALAALSLTFDLPDEAPFLLFAAGRLSGWLAHALEQIELDQLIRPRARFVPRAEEQ